MSPLQLAHLSQIKKLQGVKPDRAYMQLSLAMFTLTRPAQCKQTLLMARGIFFCLQLPQGCCCCSCSWTFLNIETGFATIKLDTHSSACP